MAIIFNNIYIAENDIFLLTYSNAVLCNSSCCSESQREAALLLGQFAATDSDCKVSMKFSVLSLYGKVRERKVAKENPKT